MSGLEGKVAVVTGSVGRLGRATAVAFREAGARTVLVDRSSDRLRATYPRLVDDRDHLLAGEVDLLDPVSVERAVARVLERFGAVDVLVNGVGGYRGGKSVHEEEAETWGFLFDVNVRTAVNACRAVMPPMLAARSGAIVNVAAQAALRGRSGLGAYCASKSAVVRLTETLAAEIGPAGVNVNCVLPGTLRTDDAADAGDSTAVATEDVASVILFLTSPAARSVHGAAIPVGRDG
jgi:NAD(P)-dependent dehydrogenase (short-subunit alcohol dehydrogenase family)